MANFVWDEDKRIKNLLKHGQDFADAHWAFEDEFAFSAPDDRYAFDDRWILIGRSNKDTVVVLAYKEPVEDTYRIISMRPAQKQEQLKYEQEKQERMAPQDDSMIQLLEQLERDRQLKEELESMKDELQRG